VVAVAAGSVVGRRSACQRDRAELVADELGVVALLG